MEIFSDLYRTVDKTQQVNPKIQNNDDILNNKSIHDAEIFGDLTSGG